VIVDSRVRCQVFKEQFPPIVYTTPNLYSIVMNSIFISVMELLNRFAYGVDFINKTHAPLDTDGAHPSDSLFEKEASEILELWLNPAVGLSDLVILTCTDRQNLLT